MNTQEEELSLEDILLKEKAPESPTPETPEVTDTPAEETLPEETPEPLMPEDEPEEPEVEPLAPAEEEAPQEAPATLVEEPAAPVEAPVAPVFDTTEIIEHLDGLKGLMETLNSDFARKLRYDAAKQEIIDRQHTELERFRREESAKLSKAIIMDVIEEIDSAEKNEKFYEPLECNEENFAKLKKLVLRVSEDLRDLLERHDIFAYRSTPGSAFDAKRQRVLKTIPTEQQELHKQIQESIRWGFEKDDKVIRPEQVAVYSYQAPAAK